MERWNETLFLFSFFFWERRVLNETLFLFSQETENASLSESV